MTGTRTIFALIPIHLGELIIAKSHLDTVKHEFEKISLCFDQDTWARYWDIENNDWAIQKIKWDQYMNDIGQLFFSETPYILSSDPKDHILYHTCNQLVAEQKIPPMKPKLGHLLCQGTPLNIGEEYVVVTTKARSLDMNRFRSRSNQFIFELKRLSQKYKIVILGEKIVEMRKEYKFEEHQNRIFSIYDAIVNNISPDRICDLTVPSLGNTAYNLQSIQQDCLIMRDAKFVITFGCGGNFIMSLASSKLSIGYREDDFAWNNILFENKEYPDASISNNWEYFITKLARY